MGLVAGQTVLITGLGPVGLGAIVNARARGAKVIAVESFPWRVDRALQMGAAAVLHPRDPSNVSRIKELSKGLGVDCALDCSGTVAGQRLCSGFADGGDFQPGRKAAALLNQRHGSIYGVGAGENRQIVAIQPVENRQRRGPVLRFANDQRRTADRIAAVLLDQLAKRTRLMFGPGHQHG